MPGTNPNIIKRFMDIDQRAVLRAMEQKIDDGQSNEPLRNCIGSRRQLTASKDGCSNFSYGMWPAQCGNIRDRNDYEKNNAETASDERKENKKRVAVSQIIE